MYLYKYAHACIFYIYLQSNELPLYFPWIDRSYLYDPDRGGWRGENRAELRLEFLVEHYTWKKLPRVVFDIYGGFEAAKVKRARVLEQKAVELSKAAQMAEKGTSSLATTVDERTAQDEEAGKKRPRSESVDGVGAAGDSNVNNPSSSMALPRLNRQPLPVLKKPTRPTSVAPLIASVSWVMLPGTVDK
jgi:hypothetical protein